MSAEQIKPSENAVVQGDNQFAVDLYLQLDREQSDKKPLLFAYQRFPSLGDGSRRGPRSNPGRDGENAAP